MPTSVSVRICPDLFFVASEGLNLFVLSFLSPVCPTVSRFRSSSSSLLVCLHKSCTDIFCRFSTAFEAHPFTVASIPSSDKKTNSDVVFLIGAKDGFTGRLSRMCKSHGGRFEIPAYLDGPYGNIKSLDSYSSVVLIAGESSAAFPFFHKPRAKPTRVFSSLRWNWGHLHSSSRSSARSTGSGGKLSSFNFDLRLVHQKRR